MRALSTCNNKPGQRSSHDDDHDRRGTTANDGTGDDHPNDGNCGGDGDGDMAMAMVRVMAAATMSTTMAVATTMKKSGDGRGTHTTIN